MMDTGSATLHRTPTHDLSTRSDGRTVFGIAVPFDREAKVNDGFGPYTEVFKRGAFAKTIRENGSNVKLLVNHDKYQRLPIGKATTLREDAAGLYGEFRVSQTREGDETLTLIRDGVVDAFSIGFVPVKEREPRPGLVERTEVRLTETSVVAFPSYEHALIGGVRSQLGLDDDEVRRLVTLVREHPELLDQISDTSTVEAVEPDPDGVGSEPPDEGTRDDAPPDLGHSSLQSESPPPVRSRADRLHDRRLVAAMVAAANAKER
jgi:HK97 family phage prohead protease